MTKEDPLTQAERHVRDGERRVASIAGVADKLGEAPKHGLEAARAKKVLSTLQRSLELAREHLRMERQERGLEP